MDEIHMFCLILPAKIFTHCSSDLQGITSKLRVRLSDMKKARALPVALATHCSA
jgi:hypothetical protein